MEVRMSLRVGVLLSGCGVFDGSEIHEAVSILVALDRRGAEIICIAPSIPQAEVINHVTKAPTREKRNVLEESARIARGKIRDLKQVSADDIDALILPGGFGAAKNLCTFAVEGAECDVQPDVARIFKEMHAAKKAIGLACISPVVAARVFGEMKLHPRLTIGSDQTTAAAIHAMGGQHHHVGPTDAYVDEDNRLVSSPCYMNDVGPWIVFQGAERLVEEVLRLAGDQSSLIRSHLATMDIKF
jgi:enhancing lycopene biosynthesis protein 2